MFSCCKQQAEIVTVISDGFFGPFATDCVLLMAASAQVLLGSHCFAFLNGPYLHPFDLFSDFSKQTLQVLQLIMVKNSTQYRAVGFELITFKT